MTKAEAKMIAVELAKLMKPQIMQAMREAAIEATTQAREVETDEYLNSKEAAEFLKMSESALRHNLSIPRTKVAGIGVRYSKNSLTKYLLRR